jgi:hypothetical protein
MRAPPQMPCVTRSKPYQHGRTTSTVTLRSRHASTPSLARPGSTPGPAGVRSNVYCCTSRHFCSSAEILDDHFFDALTTRTCHGHPLPCNDISGACVSEADAAAVFAIGDFEYESVSPCCLAPSFLRSSPADGPLTFPYIQIHSYIWHAAQNASTYNSLSFGKIYQQGTASDPYLTRQSPQARSLPSLQMRSRHPCLRTAWHSTLGTTVRSCASWLGLVPFR